MAALAAPGVTSAQRRSRVTVVGAMPRAAPARCRRLARSCSSEPRRTISRLDVGEAGEHRVGVALADGRALGEDELEEMTCGVDLRVQVDEQLSLEDRAHDDCISL